MLAVAFFQYLRASRPSEGESMRTWYDRYCRHFIFDNLVAECQPLEHVELMALFVTLTLAGSSGIDREALRLMRAAQHPFGSI